MRPLHDSPPMRTRRRALRATATPSERRLWTLLRQRQTDGVRFRRQHSIGRFVVDFYCVALRLAVEVDGLVHARPEVRAYDAERSAWLRAQGIRILRVPNAAVQHDPVAVAVWIAQQARQRAAEPGGPCVVPDPNGPLAMPSAATVTLPLPAGMTPDEARLRFATALFEGGDVSLGAAAEVAGCSYRAFVDVLLARGVDVWRYDEAEWAEDVQALERRLQRRTDERSAQQ